MARPIKLGLQYFPFDVDFFDDEKIGAISGEYGIKGEIIAIKLLCAVYRNGYFALWNDALKMNILRHMECVSLDLLEQVVNRLVRWGFFDVTLFNSVKVLTSKGIQKRYFAAVKRRNGKTDYPYLLIPDEVSANNSSVNVCRNSENDRMTANAVPDNGINVCNNSVNVCNNPLKEKESINTSSSSLNTREEENSTLEKEAEELKRSEIWKEQIKMRYHIDDTQFDEYLELFKLECKCLGKESHININDAKRHFFNWLRFQLKEQKNRNDNGNKNTRTNSATGYAEHTAQKFASVERYLSDKYKLSDSE